MRILLLPFVATSLAIACASPEDLAQQTATLQDFCNARAKTECNTAIVTSCHVKDQGTCVTQRASACMKNVPQGTTYVPSAGPPCIQAVAAAYTTSTITAAALASVATTCEPIFTGPGAARSPCTVDYDCSTQDGLRCIIPYQMTSGKCLQPNVVQPAAPCPGEADQCPSSYYCDPMSLVCVAQGGTGAPCDYRYPSCLPGNRCPGSIFSTTCLALKPAGDACTTNADCASSLCDKANGQSQGVCADEVQLTALDSMCAVYQ
jgi:hypothetical protein